MKWTNIRQGPKKKKKKQLSKRQNNNKKPNQNIQRQPAGVSLYLALYFHNINFHIHKDNFIKTWKLQKVNENGLESYLIKNKTTAHIGQILLCAVKNEFLISWKCDSASLRLLGQSESGFTNQAYLDKQNALAHDNFTCLWSDMI
ncbi:MAG: hypothetical protein ACRDAW_01160 [Metamycoplasmataceae bacterium]